MGVLFGERKILVLVVLLALCVMLIRVGWVLDGPGLGRTAGAQSQADQTEQQNCSQFSS